MQRTDWRTNPGAVGVALVGVLFLALGASLYGSGVYFNEVESCESLAAAYLDPPTIAQACDVLRVDRRVTVRNLGVLGLVLTIVALATARWRWLYADEDRPASWSAPAWALLTPILPFIATAVAYDSGVLLHVGPPSIAAGVLAASYAASVLRVADVRAHLLGASAVAVPVICAGIGAVQVIRWRQPSRPWRVQDAQIPSPPDWSLFLVPLGVTAVVFAIAVALAKLHRPAPNIWVSALLFTISTAATVPVFVPDLVPAWRGGWDHTPGPSVWLPILLTPALLAVLVWAACAARRVRAPEPAAFS